LIHFYKRHLNMEMYKFNNLAKFCKSSVNLQDVKLSKIESTVCGLAIKIFFSSDKVASLEDEVVMLKWTSFLESQLKHYNNQSKQYQSSLLYLDNLLSSSNNLRCLGSETHSEDIFLSTYILEKGYNSQRYPAIQRWASKSLEGYLVPNPREEAKESTKSAKEKKQSEKRPKVSKEKAKVSEKLKILCLHGYRQTGQTFRTKTGSFRKVTGKFAEFTFITAPHQVSEEEHGWWFSTPDRTYSAKHVFSEDPGFSESLSLIEKTVREEGPFHGLLAFSQGAALGGLLLAKQEMGQLDLGIKFAILVSAFISRCGNHSDSYEEMLKSQKKIQIPTLHIMGHTDKVIEIEMSEDLLKYFDNATVLKHDGGHFVPTPGDLKEDLLNFLQKMWTTFIQ